LAVKADGGVLKRRVEVVSQIIISSICPVRVFLVWERFVLGEKMVS
jgi:hypothetical protein